MAIVRGESAGKPPAHDVLEDGGGLGVSPAQDGTARLLIHVHHTAATAGIEIAAPRPLDSTVLLLEFSAIPVLGGLHGL